jgi:pSer/pThr/pTyr-binding forkhead associated (FHA) protein
VGCGARGRCEPLECDTKLRGLSPPFPFDALFDLQPPQPQAHPVSAPAAGAPPAPTAFPSYVPAPPPPTSPSSKAPPTEIPAVPRTVLESASLRVLPKDPKQSALVFPVRGSLTHIGRSFESEVCIDNTAFSRTYAIITLEEGVYWLRDAGSLNGTSVNGRKLSGRESIRLADNDRIEIGDFIAIFEAHCAAAQETVA